MMYIHINLNVYAIDTHYTHFILLRFVAGALLIIAIFRCVFYEQLFNSNNYNNK